MADIQVSKQDKERIRLLDIVAKKGLDSLNIDELETLQSLVERKDYTHNKKAHKSKLRLLAKVNVAIYERSEGKQGI